MKWFLLIVFAIILVAAQIGFLPFFRIFGILPDLLVIIPVFILIFRNFQEAIFFAFFSGIFFDFLASNSRFGLISVSLFLTILSIEIASHFIKKKDFSPFLILIFIAGIIYSFFTGIFLFVFYGFREPVFEDFAVRILTAKTIYNLSAAAIIFFFIKYGRFKFPRKTFKF